MIKIPSLYYTTAMSAIYKKILQLKYIEPKTDTFIPRAVGMFIYNSKKRWTKRSELNGVHFKGLNT